MGLFERFFGKKGPAFTERFWLTTAGKMADLVAQVRASLERGSYPVTVVHFKGTLELLLDVLQKNDIRFHKVESSIQFPARLADEELRQEGMLVLLSDAIPASVLRSEFARPKDTKLAAVSVHLAEHYPSYNRDQQVLNLDRAWPMQMEFTCYTALDEPWLAAFGAERLRQVMERLGINEKSVLSHPYLYQSIRNAQQKISRQVLHEQACDTCEEWMRVNMADRIKCQET